MAKFMVIYRAPIDAIQQTSNTTPEEAAEGIKAWMDWAAKCGDKLVNMGSPLGNGTNVLPGGRSAKGDGTVTGYSVLQAESLDEAKTLLEGHPHLGWNQDCVIELHEMLPVPGT